MSLSLEKVSIQVFLKFSSLFFKRLPYSFYFCRYCLDNNDQGSESEEEIFAESNGNDEELFDDETMQADR